MCVVTCSRVKSTRTTEVETLIQNLLQHVRVCSFRMELPPEGNENPKTHNTSKPAHPSWRSNLGASHRSDVVPPVLLLSYPPTLRICCCGLCWGERGEPAGQFMCWVTVFHQGYFIVFFDVGGCLKLPVSDARRSVAVLPTVADSRANHNFSHLAVARARWSNALVAKRYR